MGSTAGLYSLSLLTEKGDGAGRLYILRGYAAQAGGENMDGERHFGGTLRR